MGDKRLLDMVSVTLSLALTQKRMTPRNPGNTIVTNGLHNDSDQVSYHGNASINTFWNLWTHTNIYTLVKRNKQLLSVYILKWSPEHNVDQSAHWLYRRMDKTKF